MYSTLTRDFAERASALAASATRSDLLYAALEIRMGVEARLHSYVQANDEVSEALKRGWQIPKLFKGLEKTFSNSSQVVEFVVSAANSEPAILHFIPVIARLRNHAEKFGNALHITATSHSPDKWWNDLKEAVAEAVLDLHICSRATLLGVPLLETKTGHVMTEFEFHNSDPRLGLMHSLARTKEPHHFKVTYISTDEYYAVERERFLVARPEM